MTIARPRLSRPPAHLVNGRARTPIESFTGDEEAVLLVKADSARIVLVDVQVEPGRRYPLGFVEARRREPHAPGLGSDHRLINIERPRIDGDAAEHFPARFCHPGPGRRHAFLAPALPPPGDPIVEIGGGAG